MQHSRFPTDDCCGERRWMPRHVAQITNKQWMKRPTMRSNKRRIKRDLYRWVPARLFGWKKNQLISDDFTDSIVLE